MSRRALRPGTRGSLSEGSPPADPVGYLQLLRSNRRFRFFWLSELISLFGDWFNFLASTTLIAQLTDSGLAFGLLFALRMLMPALLSPIAGVAADRYDRKQLMLWTTLARGVVVLGFLQVRNVEDAWLVYLLTAIQLGLSGIFIPARSALLPEIVSRRELGAANALDSVTWSTMLAFGAAAGGLVAGIWGVNVAFVIDSLTFFLAALLILGIDHEARPREGGDLRAALRQYVAGWSYLREHRDIFYIALHKAAFAIVISGAIQSVVTKLLSEVFVFGKEGAIGLGLMFATVGVGTGIGPLVARAFARDREWQIRRALVWVYPLSSFGILVMATATAVGLALTTTGAAALALRLDALGLGPLGAWIARFPPDLQLSLAFGLLLLGVLFRAAGGGTNWVLSAHLLLDKLPDGVRGRVLATELAIFALCEATGSLVGGALADAGIGYVPIMIGTALVALLPALLWARWIRSRRAIDPGLVGLA